MEEYGRKKIKKGDIGKEKGKNGYERERELENYQIQSI